MDGYFDVLSDEEEKSTQENVLRKSKLVAEATEWSGDIRVNFNTVMCACRVLARRVKELEEILNQQQTAQEGNDNA